MEKIIQNLKEILKSNLVTVAEYGKQDRQHLIVLEKLDSNTLKSIKPIMKTYFKKTKKLPLILTKEELTDGLDVFPLEFLNIKLNHNILEGKDLFKNLNFEKKHIRRELEFEFRSKLINLRQGYLEADSNKDLKLITQKAIPTLLPILNGLLFLKDIEIPDSLDGILDLIPDEYKVNIDILKNIENADYEYAIKELIILLSTLAEILDEMKA